MTIDEAHKIIDFAISKNQNGSVTASEKDRVINLGQKSYMSYLLGSFQTYQPGRPISKVELGQNMTVRQRLTPVITETTLTVDGTTGVSSYPGDYLQTDAMYTSTGFNRITAVQQDSLPSYINSVIDPIADNPIYLLKGNGFQFYPVSIGTARLSYVKNPPAVVWGNTLDGNGRKIYNPATSVQPVFDDLAMLEVIVRSLSLVGCNLQFQQVQQYAENIKTQGQ